MMRRNFLLSSTLLLVSSLTVFPQTQTQKPPAPQEEQPSVFTVPKDYRYNAKGRRDPFVNPVPKPKAAEVAQQQKSRPPGLKGVLVSEAQIAGVVTSGEPSMNVVVISAPGARAAYFARVGDQLFDAVVKNIRMDAVTFTLTASNNDPKAPREIVRKLRSSSGDNK